MPRASLEAPDSELRKNDLTPSRIPAVDGYRRILLPTDFSPASRRALMRGAELAKRSSARVLLLFVVEKSFFMPLSMVPQAGVTFSGEGDLLGEAVEDGEKRLKALVEELFRGIVCEARVVVAASAPAGILEQAESFRPDLVVIAAHGRGAVERLLMGSTTEKVVRHATCEVLVVRG
jgi:nucleotide-binding universal stress UspA family protein